MSSRLRNADVCATWVFSNNSNVHVAKDLEWFVEYRPFRSFIGGLAGEMSEVVGVGTVEIPVKAYPNRSGSRAHRILRLQHVLHVPKFLCNILGSQGTGYYAGVALLPGPHGEVWGHDKWRLALLHTPIHRQGRFNELLLSGYPLGPKPRPSPFRENTIYMLHAIWPVAERRRWYEHRGVPLPGHWETATDFVTLSPWLEKRAGGQNEVEAYTSEEKEWLKRAWGNEYRFLRVHGLDIHKEEDREEGVQIVRALMSSDDDSGSEAGPTTGSSQIPLGQGSFIGACWPAMGNNRSWGNH